MEEFVLLNAYCGQNDNDKKNRKEETVRKTKTLSRFFICRLRFTIYHASVFSVAICRSCERDLHSSVMSINQINQYRLFIDDKVIKQLK